MSQGNVELTRRAYDALARRDLDAFLAFMDPEVVAMPRILAVEGGALRGHDGIREWWDRILSAFPDFDAEVTTIRGRGDFTVAGVRARGRGHGSGVPIEDAIWVASRVRDGKVTWWQTCGSEAEALEAVGLRKETMAQETVEVVREALEAWNVGDMDRLRDLYDPDAILRAPPDFPPPRALFGRDAIIEMWSELRSVWDADSMRLLSDFRTAGDRVVVRVDWRGDMRGFEANMALTFAYTVRTGRVLALEVFRDHDEALEAAGLE